MRKITSFLLGLSIILIPVLLSAQKSNTLNRFLVKDKKHESAKPAFQSQHRGALYPHQAMVYGWDQGGKTWELSNAEKYTWHSNGKNMYTYTLASDFSDTFQKETTFYDAYGYTTFESMEFDDGSGNLKMAFGYRTTLKYYAPPKLESSVDEFFYYDKWMNNYKTIYSHNANGLLTGFIEQAWDSVKSEWVNEYKYDLIYDSNNINKEVNGFYWGNNTWKKEMHAYISWYIFSPYNTDAGDVFDSMEMQVWDTVSSKFVNDYKMKVTRDANGGTIETDYAWMDEWIPMSRYTEKYDASKNHIGTVEEEWSGTEWDKQFEEVFDLTYTSGNVTEKIEKYWYYGDPPGEFTNNAKYVYSDFTSMKENRPARLSIYPQPADQYIMVEMPAAPNNACDILITDMNGRVVIKTNIPDSASQIRLDVSSLAKGMYVISIKSSSSVISQLMVK